MGYGINDGTSQSRYVALDLFKISNVDWRFKNFISIVYKQRHGLAILAWRAPRTMTKNISNLGSIFDLIDKPIDVFGRVFGVVLNHIAVLNGKRSQRIANTNGPQI